MSRIIEVVPYNPIWPSLYRKEAGLVAAIFAGDLILSHHIGSTAIPGIKAKPVIDILIEVRDIETVKSYNEAMIALGYELRGENGIPGRRYFKKANRSIHTHHLHTFQLGHPKIERHLNFRDYLRVNPKRTRAYSHLKEELAQKHKFDSIAYTKGKSNFVSKIDRMSASWRQELFTA